MGPTVLRLACPSRLDADMNMAIELRRGTKVFLCLER